MTIFKPGDLVVLKSGGPTMTVLGDSFPLVHGMGATSLSSTDSYIAEEKSRLTGLLRCIWFPLHQANSGVDVWGCPQHEDFHPDSLAQAPVSVATVGHR